MPLLDSESSLSTFFSILTRGIYLFVFMRPLSVEYISYLMFRQNFILSLPSFEPVKLRVLKRETLFYHDVLDDICRSLMPIYTLFESCSSSNLIVPPQTRPIVTNDLSPYRTNESTPMLILSEAYDGPLISNPFLYYAPLKGFVLIFLLSKACVHVHAFFTYFIVQDGGSLKGFTSFSLHSCIFQSD